MRSLVLQLDHWLFLKINTAWTHPWLDGFFSEFTNLIKEKWFVALILPGFLAWLSYKQKMVAVKVLVTIAITVAITDSFSYEVIKSQFSRVRPNQSDIGAILRVPYGPMSGSFPSNHAVNTFAIANILAYYWPEYFWLYYAFAALMGYSRIYVGVHYPLDVIAGMIFGLLIAAGLRKFIFLRIPWFRKGEK